LWIPVLSALAVIAGHNWPVFFGFRGGKGIATTIGVLATLCFLPALCAGIIAILSIVFTRYVSLGSLLFVALTPLSLWLFDYPHEILWASLIICVFGIWRHKSNIRKLVRREEHKLSFRTKGKGETA
jgi:glycerol-3-phosphate acyltransferase PlsY